MPVVCGDQERLAELFQNLIENALKFSQQAEATAIKIDAHRIGDRVECSIADNGIGIETQYLWMAGYTALGVPFYLALSPVFGRRQAA